MRAQVGERRTQSRNDSPLTIRALIFYDSSKRQHAEIMKKKCRSRRNSCRNLIRQSRDHGFAAIDSYAPIGGNHGPFSNRSSFSESLQKERSMNIKLATAVLLFAATPLVALAQQNGPPNGAQNGPPPPKPTIADVQKVAQSISSDPAKQKAYCDMGKVMQQLDQAEQKNDAKAGKALSAKADALAQQLGPDYQKVMDGLDSVDPNSEEGKKFNAVLEPLYKQCK
jgi:hypothetical protein